MMSCPVPCLVKTWEAVLTEGTMLPVSRVSALPLMTRVRFALEVLVLKMLPFSVRRPLRLLTMVQPARPAAAPDSLPITPLTPLTTTE